MLDGCDALPWLAALDAVEAAPFQPLLQATDWAVGRAAQSLDGFIATRDGSSRWIGGPADILHTHRLRALCDAVVVGAATIRADDPRLTTRACAGISPVRVVIDPHRRLSADHRVFATDAPTLLLCRDDAPDTPQETLGHVETLRLPRREDGWLCPRHIRDVLARRGLRRLLIEGGGRTVGAFLRAGALDRLHVTIAPLLLGEGLPGVAMHAAATPAEGLRLQWHVHPLGEDVLLDATPVA